MEKTKKKGLKIKIKIKLRKKFLFECIIYTVGDERIVRKLMSCLLGLGFCYFLIIYKI